MNLDGLPPRIVSKIAVTADGCWQWIAYVGPKGYGYVAPGDGTRRPVLAHRFVYELLAGPIPGGLPLDHLCRNRACVWPEHLEPVTTGENNARQPARRLPARATHCRRGHAFDGANTYWRADGARSCRACGAQHVADKRAARRAAALTTTTA